MFFLVRSAISTFQIYRTRHLPETELDTISPHLILPIPFLFRFHLIYLFSVVVDQFHSDIRFDWVQFH